MLRKSLLMALALCCLLGSAALAAQPVAISEMNVDFGSMTEGPVAKKTVTLTNVSKGYKAALLGKTK